MEPLQEATLDTESLTPAAYGTRRTGRPRMNWAKATMKEYWDIIRDALPNEIHGEEVDVSNIRHKEAVLLAAYGQTARNTTAAQQPSTLLPTA